MHRWIGLAFHLQGVQRGALWQLKRGPLNLFEDKSLHPGYVQDVATKIEEIWI